MSLVFYRTHYFLISEIDVDNAKEICYTYDNQGNILTKQVNDEITDYKYEIGTNKLVSFGNETCAYDIMGNPITYRGDTCEWGKGRQLNSITDGTNTVSFDYDGKGLRTKKTAGGVETSYIYQNGKLLREKTGDSEIITYIYGTEGIIGFKLNNAKYLYKKEPIRRYSRDI